MQVATTDSTAVTTLYVCGHYVYNSEDTCKTMSLHVTRLICVFHGMSREGDRTAFMHRRMLTSKLVSATIKIKSYHIANGTMTYQARGIIKAFASVCGGREGGIKSFESSKFYS